MMLKVPQDILHQLEEKRLLYRIPIDIGFKIEHKEGQTLSIYGDNIELLHLAVDTMKFWTSTKALSVENICLLEKKKVVWKSYENYARKLVHLFEHDINSLINVEVVRNNKLKKNVSAVELWCKYEHFKAVDPKIENICREVENLNHTQIKVKHPDIVKARQFVTNKLDNDTNVLCVYNERDKTLDIFSKNIEYIAQAETEFKHGPLKVTERGLKAGTTTTTKTTEMHIKASSFTQPRASITEPKNKHVSSFTDSKSPLSKSMKITKQSLASTDVALKDSSLKRSLRDEKGTDPTQSVLTNNSTKYLTQSPKGATKSSIKSNDSSSKIFSHGLNSSSGSNFLHEFTLSGLKVSVYPHSIVDVKGVDAIVNAANDIMVHGGGVAYHISKAAGKKMDEEGRAYVSNYGKLRVGENCVTGAGRLPYEGIIHAVGPQWADYMGAEDRCAEDLYKTIRNTLKAARDKKFQRIALCAISAGIYGVPKELCAEMYIKALADFSEEGVGSVSEVHFVDVNLEILGFVKDAHEKWCRMPASIHFKNAFNYPSATGRRHVSNTSNLPATSHQQGINEFSLVDFMGQSKTIFDGSPVYTFKICGSAIVKVYTGNLLRLDCVDAIVCVVNSKITGGLAAAVAKAAGPSYRQDLNAATRRQRSISEGETVICNAGALRVKKVMHVVVMNQVQTVNAATLNKLKFINQSILQEANFNMIQAIGMSLIGTGLLNREDDIVECSQRFAKDVIEFCRTNVTKLSVKEIHVVNLDARRTLIVRDSFQRLVNPAFGLAAGNDNARSIRGQPEKSTVVDYKGRNLKGPTENSTIGLERDTHETRSIRSQMQNSNLGLAAVDENTGRNHGLPLGHANSDVHDNFEELSVIEKTRGRKKTLILMKPLNSKSVRCSNYNICGNGAEWSMSCGHVFCTKCKPQLEVMEKCAECTEKDETEVSEMTPDSKVTDDTCPVCLSDFTDPVDLPCCHRLCKHCLEQLEKHKPCCPICNTAFGVITGTQPKGTMKYKEIPDSLPGFQSCNAIQIIYDFPCGTQGKEHPKPGRPFKGTQRHAFLPNNREGKTVLKLLQVAFDRRLIFTIGDSRTTGKQNQVTWNDIHHKTAKSGGTENFGYPDPDYLDRVRDELAAKGVTEESLK